MHSLHLYLYRTESKLDVVPMSVLLTRLIESGRISRTRDTPTINLYKLLCRAYKLHGNANPESSYMASPIGFTNNPLNSVVISTISTFSLFYVY